MWHLVGKMGIKSSPVPFEANGQSIELQSDSNGPAMDSPWSQMELGAHFPSVPCMLGTKFLFGMRVLRELTRSKKVWPWKVTISGPNKPCPKHKFEKCIFIWWALYNCHTWYLKKQDMLTPWLICLITTFFQRVHCSFVSRLKSTRKEGHFFLTIHRQLF